MTSGTQEYRQSRVLSTPAELGQLAHHAGQWLRGVDLVGARAAQQRLHLAQFAEDELALLAPHVAAAIDRASLFAHTDRFDRPYAKHPSGRP